MIPTLQLGGGLRARYHAPAGGGGGSDPYFSNVELLLHGNGSNGGTTFTDSGPDARTMTSAGNVQTSTTQVKYGSASLKFDGSGDYLNTPYSTTDFQWWGSDFTVECWVYPTSLTGWANGSGIGTIIGNANATANTIYWSLGISGAGKLVWYYWTGGTNFVTSTPSLSLNAWTHVAMVHKSGSGVQLYVGGVGSGYSTLAGTPQHSASEKLQIGQINNACCTGYIDDLRVTRGVARYTADFTPPSAEFPDS